MFSKRLVMLFGAIILISGCATIASKTNILSNEKIKTETSAALGYQPSDLTIVSRKTEGINTYVDLKARDAKEFICVINGGNLLSGFMTNPPMCHPKT